MSEEPERWLRIPVGLPEPGETAAFELAGLRMLLCNVEGAPFVIRDRCPHALAPLSGGRLRGSVLECPVHGGRLDVRSGAPLALPIRHPARCHPVREGGLGLEVGLPPPA